MLSRLRSALAPHGDEERRFRVALRWSAGAAAVLFVLLLWNVGFDPLRAALPGREFSGFFDHQAESLLEGRLDVEPGVAGIEAFIVDGKEYLYFPPGPAVLRLPIVAFTDRLEGRLTAPSMLLAWGLIVVLASRLLWEVRRQFRQGQPLGRWELSMYAMLHFAICGGSVVLYLAGMPWVYHEAYMWSIALTIGALVTLIRVQESPSRGRVLALGGYILGAMMVRTTAGWALAGTALLLAAFVAVRRRGSTIARFAVPIALAGLVPLLVGVAVNWAKFQHPYLFPLEKQVFTGLSEQRQRALAANGGDLVSFDILPTTLVNYFRPDGIRATTVFPYLSLPARPAPTYGNSVIDQSYRTGSVVAFMPVLFGLSMWGVVALVRPSTRGLTRRLRFPVLATLLGSGPVMFYGYLAYRYTSEFVPALALGSAIGLTDLAGRWSTRSRPFRRNVLGAGAVVVAFSAFANLTAGVSIMSISSGGPDLERYVKTQMRLGDLTGGSFDHLVVQSDDLPRESVTDQIRIIGDCDAAFIGTGDTYGPWEVLAMREWTYDFTVADGITGSERLLLATVPTSGSVSTIEVEIEPTRFRSIVSRPDETFVGEWYPIEAGRFRMELLASTEYRVYSVEPAPDDDKIVVPIQTFDGEMNLPNFLMLRDTGSEHVTVTVASLPTSTLCTDLLARATRVR